MAVGQQMSVMVSSGGKDRGESVGRGAMSFIHLHFHGVCYEYLRQVDTPAVQSPAS